MVRHERITALKPWQAAARALTASALLAAAGYAFAQTADIARNRAMGAASPGSSCS